MAEEPVSRHGKGFSAYRNSRFLMAGQANQLTVSMIGKPQKTAYLQPKDCPRANAALFPDYDEYLFTQRTAFLHIHAFCVPPGIMYPDVPHAACPHLAGA